MLHPRFRFMLEVKPDGRFRLPGKRGVPTGPASDNAEEAGSDQRLRLRAAPPIEREQRVQNLRRIYSGPRWVSVAVAAAATTIVVFTLTHWIAGLGAESIGISCGAAVIAASIQCLNVRRQRRSEALRFEMPRHQRHEQQRLVEMHRARHSSERSQRMVQREARWSNTAALRIRPTAAGVVWTVCVFAGLAATLIVVDAANKNRAEPDPWLVAIWLCVASAISVYHVAAYHRAHARHHRWLESQDERHSFPDMSDLKPAPPRRAAPKRLNPIARTIGPTATARLSTSTRREARGVLGPLPLAAVWIGALAVAVPVMAFGFQFGATKTQMMNVETVGWIVAGVNVGMLLAVVAAKVARAHAAARGRRSLRDRAPCRATQAPTPSTCGVLVEAPPAVPASDAADQDAANP